MMDRNLKIAVGIGAVAIIVMLYLIYSGFGGVPMSYVSTRETETQRMSKALQSLTAPEEKPVSADVLKSLTVPKN